MKAFLYWLFFPLFLLTACSSTALVDFQESRVAETLWLAEEAGQNGVTLRFTGIYALSEKIVFLYGGLVADSGSLRSVLLRSTDSGRRWKEVMAPEAGSEITGLHFLADGQGWAVVQWLVNGPGPAFLYYSQDSGAHWQRISEFPLAGMGGHSYPCELKFWNGLHGSVRILNRITLACCRYETADGGFTWRKTDDCLSKDECLIATPSECRRALVSWKYEVLKSEAVITISRSGTLEDSWTEVSRFPLRYGYQRGKILPLD